MSIAVPPAKRAARFLGERCSRSAKLYAPDSGPDARGGTTPGAPELDETIRVEIDGRPLWRFATRDNDLWFAELRSRWEPLLFHTKYRRTKSNDQQTQSS